MRGRAIDDAARDAALVRAKQRCLMLSGEQADTIALLPGWERSKGAKAEFALFEALGESGGEKVCHGSGGIVLLRAD